MEGKVFSDVWCQDWMSKSRYMMLKMGHVEERYEWLVVSGARDE